MGTLFFLVVLMCLAIVLAWYIENESKNADGELGFLAISARTAENTDQPDQHCGAYRMKDRTAGPGAPAIKITDEREAGTPAYKVTEERKSYREQEKSSYRAKPGQTRYSVKERIRRDPGPS